jgi:hypothetical protein
LKSGIFKFTRKVLETNNINLLCRVCWPEATKVKWESQKVIFSFSVAQCASLRSFLPSLVRSKNKSKLNLDTILHRNLAKLWKSKFIWWWPRTVRPYLILDHQLYSFLWRAVMKMNISMDKTQAALLIINIIHIFVYFMA